MTEYGRKAAVVLVGLIFLSIFATSLADEALYYACQSCHEKDGSGNEAIGAPAIAGMNAEYVATQMKKFRDGLRGASIDDLPGRQMNLIASLITDDAEILALAEFVASMPKAEQQATMQAMTGNGAELFKQCAICHGDNGAGKPDLSAPAIAGMDDWYVRSQLMRFRNGSRGGHSGDQSGAQMQAAVSTLSDESIHELSVHTAALEKN